ncbi:MAG: DUF2231 domain-containing protein [Gemmatirosa sp.]
MYSLAHLHLLLNHLPIIVTGLGLLLLAVAVARRRDELARVALAFFVGGGLSALPTYLTGEPAEETVENLPGVTEAIIERHEDAALVAAILVGALGAFALWALWRYRRPGALPGWVVRVALVAAVVGSGAMAWTGLLGGEVRHTEIRPDFVPPAHVEGTEGS